MRATRRAFLQGSAAATAGLLIGFRLPELAAAEEEAALFEPNAFIQIAPDETVTLFVIRQEMGQGVRTVLPMMLAEELEADWARVRLEQAMPGPRFAGVRLHTSGSGSSTGTYRTLRQAGAAAREMLVATAAAIWGVAPASCRAEKGAVIHPPSKRRLTYGQLVPAAARQPVPKEPRLKDPASFTVLGKPMARVDGRDIVTGRAQYGIDARVPGMLHASIERAPSLGAKLVRFDPAPALAVPGVLQVVPVTAGIHQGVAVVARDTWSALRGREALKVTWKPGAHAVFDSDRFIASLPEAVAAGSFVVRHEGDALAALKTAACTHTARYVFPFQAHAPMETMNCTADVRADGAELWAPTQTVLRTMAQAVKVTGLPEEKIRIHPMLMGGGFGRRLFADFAAEACQISKAIGKPVQVLWTREDDLRHGYFQPATGDELTAGLDDTGGVVALVHRTSASDLTIYDIHDGKDIWAGLPRDPRPADEYAKDESPWGAFDNPYKFPHLRVDCADVTSPVPTGPWRAVQYPPTVFARESFLDELAHLAGKDPVEFRLALLPAGVQEVGSQKIDRGRLARALSDVVRRSDWHGPLPKDPQRRWGRGVAASTYDGSSYIAMVAEVSVASDLSDLRVHRIVASIDCGFVLNPLGAHGQAESGITWGLSAALAGKMDFREGRAVQGSLSEFEAVRTDRMPKLEIAFLQSDAPPSGFGEHPVPPVAPAVAAAVFSATGKRLRTLPITTEAIRKA